MRRAGLLLAAGLALAVPARAGDSILGTVETVTLKNGLRLVLAPDSAAKSVDVTVWYDAGSRYDRPGKTGVAHLFEHLMFRGSAHFGPDEHARQVRAEGGTSGAFATSDFIALYETLPADDLELALKLEADRMAGLTFTQAALDAERRQVAEERERRATPITHGLQRIYELAFPTTPYGVPVYGREADLPGLTLKDFQEFYRAAFVPGRAVVTVVGGFRRDDALALAKKYLEPIKGGSSRPQPIPADRPQAAERRLVDHVPAPLRVLLVGWPIPSRTDPDWAPLNLLATYLTRGSEAPLGKALVLERPLCLSVQGDVDTRRDGSMLYLAVAVAPNADSAEVERTLLAEVDRASKQPASDADLERAKRQSETGAWFSLQTTRDRGQALGSGLMLAGDPRDLERQLARMRACTAKDLQRVAARLGPQRRNLVWLLPSQEPGGMGGSAGTRP